MADPAADAGPDLVAIQAALHKTTEALAYELASPRETVPDWSDTEWQVAKAVSAIHGVSGLLSQTLRWSGPQHWHAFLADQRAQVAARLPRIQALLRLIDANARERGIPCVALKGCALHARGIYVSGERPMADIDLLVRPADAGRAAGLLESIGFCAGVETWKHRVFNPAHSIGTPTNVGETADADIKIEMHGAIREILPLRPVDITQLVFAHDMRAGINGYPTPAALLLHILLHASGAMIGRSLRLLHLNDIHRLTRGLSGAEWQEIFRMAELTDDPNLWWAFAPLALTNRYFGGVPPAVLERMAAGCPWLLRQLQRRRRLSQVSLSYLWVSAFPGIEWSQSLGELSAYAARRLVPSRKTVALRRAYADALPQICGGEWAETSQSRRIVRWLRARQPRQETMLPVRAALRS